MKIMKGEWKQETAGHNHGWYFYPNLDEGGGFFYLPKMKHVSTYEKGGKAVGIQLKYPGYEPVTLPPLPEGVDLTSALKGR
tara:strand:+ start:124 stop:366 length:243 start_codon:yes stop_codon:yes gene_type:complete